MILTDILNFENNKELIDINFNSVFTDKIIPYFYSNLDIKLGFVEIGALDGKDTIYFKSIYKNSVCHCIEGLKANYDKYLHNFREEHNITPHNICIASYDGTIKYHEKTTNGIHGIYNRGNRYGTKTHTYDCLKFSTLCKEKSINDIDIIKIDVEGATYDILYDMEQSGLLKQTKILHIETEDYPFFEGQRLDADCTRILENNNFMCIMKSGYKPEPSGHQYDSVWINKSHLKK